ncbi:pimeloyl-ACP methyl ester carboxylesterase [Azospirillum lipoferum]|uniref:Alpha/beta hydrolase n=1 Tax=Azospirillum lipoferum TaxID=193 RepID=A0A5A9GN80_AZOLI|nr:MULTISPECIES: alpha/beta hydrolase [Azospirillum]KAA0595820.1 alpha/beta hydrolase [Azospirillum lipoferum]MCP1611301.1 pimeloyl-ACP methyl ester carboxylesterase [Azospirillum lipoferum]MDW5537105.1 alpha/beta hydrolase [Azospirillum sp. NL1]
MGFIHTDDGVRLFYRDWGKEEGSRPILFVSSWSLTSDAWAYQMAPLSEQGCRCIAFDRRGHGKSDESPSGYGFDRLADDIAALIDGLDLRDVTLVGHSMATGEIVRYLTRHGSGRVAGVVMVGTITPLMARTGDNPDGVDPALFEAFRTEQLLRDFPKWLGDNIDPFVNAETSAEMKGWITGMALQSSLIALLECNRAITSADFRAELPAITVPTLVVHGDRDVTTPLALAERTVALMPNATLSFYEGAPHGLFITHRDRFNAELLAFVRGGRQP